MVLLTELVTLLDTQTQERLIEIEPVMVEMEICHILKSQKNL